MQGASWHYNLIFPFWIAHLWNTSASKLHRTLAYFFCPFVRDQLVFLQQNALILKNCSTPCGDNTKQNHRHLLATDTASRGTGLRLMFCLSPWSRAKRLTRFADVGTVAPAQHPPGQPLRRVTSHTHRWGLIWHSQLLVFSFNYNTELDDNNMLQSHKSGLHWILKQMKVFADWVVSAFSAEVSLWRLYPSFPN